MVGGYPPSGKFAVHGADGEGTGEVGGVGEVRFAATRGWSITGTLSPGRGNGDLGAGKGEGRVATTVALLLLETCPSRTGGAGLGAGTGKVLRDGRGVAEGVARKRGSGADI